MPCPKLWGIGVVVVYKVDEDVTATKGRYFWFPFKSEGSLMIVIMITMVMMMIIVLITIIIKMIRDDDD